MKMMNSIVTSLLMIILFSTLLFAGQESRDMLAKLHRMAEQGQVDPHHLERLLRKYDLDGQDLDLPDILRDLRNRGFDDDLEMYLNEKNINKDNPMLLSKQNSSPLDQYTESTISIILDDFQVNENAGKSDKEKPDVAADGSGNFVITWIDERNGDYDIYAQRYNSNGQSQGGDFLVSDDTGISEQNYPSVAMNGSGNFVITWIDERNGNYDIYAQLYNSSGLPLGGNFLVNDDEDDDRQYFPSVAMDDSGNFVITWLDKRNDNGDVFAQRYNSSGQVLGDNFLVNDDEGISGQYSPSVAINDSGNCIIIWLDKRDGGSNSYIYAQLYDSNGQPRGGNILVSDEEGYDWQGSLSVAMDDSGDFVIAWEGERNDSTDIYMQLFNNTGQPRGDNFVINADESDFLQINPSVVMDKNSSFIITWMDFRQGNWDIYAQLYNSSGEELGTRFVVNDNECNSWLLYPSVAIGGAGNVIITWEDYRNDFHDIYAQRYDPTGQPRGGNFLVSHDEGSGDQINPSIANDGSGNFVITWEDERNGSYHYDIYAQIYNSSGQALGTNLLVSDEEGRNTQSNPSVAMGDSGKFVIAWSDNRNGNFDIFAQLYNSSGQAQGENFLVNTNQVHITTMRDPSVAMNSSGNFVVTWGDYYEYTYNKDIYAQLYNSSGQALGGNFLVNDDEGDNDQRSPFAAISDSGDFVVTWYDSRNGNDDIYAQLYDSRGQPRGSNFLVNDDEGDNSQGSPSVAVDGSGNFIITWSDKRNNDAYDIYAQIYNSSGQPRGGNFLVNDAIDNRSQYFPSVAMDSSGNFIVIWLDTRNGNQEIYAQRFDTMGKIGQNFKIHSYNQKYFRSGYDVVLTNNRVIVTWEDYVVRGQGFDVFAKMYEFKEPVTVVDEPNQQIDSFELLNCYPNPFNMSTSIEFNVATAVDVTLDIFNIRGQKINELFSGFKNAGKHRLVWDATDQYGAQVSSGIYLIEIRAGGYRKVQKVVLVK